jgi:hypothetical protein
MGGTYWSDMHYYARANHRKATGKAAFEHDDDIRQGRAVAAVHEKMDPRNFKNGVREARDSAEHPLSNSVFVGFDVTGSMHRVPHIVQQNLPTLMGLLLRKAYLADPAICIGAIGDATCDAAPLQIGQFESGIEIEDDLAKLFLEGGGGGQQTESYELAIYYLARKTVTDAFEKRGKRGYAFLIGDEMPYPLVKRKEVRRIFGDHLQADLPLEQVLAEARRKWDIYFILPNMTSYYNDPSILDCWRRLLVQNVVKLPDPAGISEMIAALVGLAEGVAGAADVERHLKEAGTNKKLVRAIRSALEPVADARRSVDESLTNPTAVSLAEL